MSKYSIKKNRNYKFSDVWGRRRRSSNIPILLPLLSFLLYMVNNRKILRTTIETRNLLLSIFFRGILSTFIVPWCFVTHLLQHGWWRVRNIVCCTPACRCQKFSRRAVLLREPPSRSKGLSFLYSEAAAAAAAVVVAAKEMVHCSPSSRATAIAQHERKTYIKIVLLLDVRGKRTFRYFK